MGTESSAANDRSQVVQFLVESCGDKNVGNLTNGLKADPELRTSSRSQFGVGLR